MVPFSFKYPGTNFMESVILLHHDVLFFLLLILITVLWLLVYAVYNYKLPSITVNSPKIVKSYFLQSYLKVEHQFTKKKRETIQKDLEFFWTVVPALFIGIMLIPSFTLLYSSDDDISPAFTVKIYGHQWYWAYEYKMEEFFEAEPFQRYPSHFKPELYLESTLIPQEDLKEGEDRLLEVTHPLVIPQNTSVRLLVTSFDVIHSWGVPALGVKVDAIPGVINQVILNVNQEGIFHGQCYELCGPMHGSMPITVYSVNFEKFLFWYSLMCKMVH